MDEGVDEEAEDLEVPRDSMYWRISDGGRTAFE